MNLKTTLLAFLLMATTVPFVKAQSTPADIAKEWERAKAFTKSYLDAMTDAGYALKPKPEMRSFAEQMLHLTDGNYGLGSLATGTQAPFKPGELEKNTTDKSKANVTKLVMAGYDFVIDGIKKMTPAQLEAKFKLFDKFEMTHEQAIAKVFEHQTHHRGQTTVYLHLAGVKPPEEKLF